MNAPRNAECDRIYREWVEKLSPAEKAKAVELKVDEPLFDDEPSHIAASDVDGYSFSAKRAQSEPDAMKLAALAESGSEVAIICGRTPFDDLAESEETISRELSYERTVQAEAISGLLSFLFAPKGGLIPSPLDVLRRVYALAYCLRPVLIEGWSMQKIADCFDITRQAFSKEVIKIADRLNIRSRNQKPVGSISIYAENTEKWHAERIQKEKKAARKQYLKDWAARNKEKKAAAAKAYYEKNKERIANQRKLRNAKRKRDGLV